MNTLVKSKQISDVPEMIQTLIKVCPECGGEVRRLIQPVGIVFKGSGFYVTDNRAKSSTSGTGSTKKPSKTSSKTSGESESTGEGSDKSD